jgi:ankyrin repeat protein
MTPEQQNDLNERLLDACLDPNAKADDIKTLLGKGADPNAKDRDGWVPLHWARNETVARLLLDKGAAADAKNIYGETPLHEAAASGREGVAKLLLDNGADPNAKNEAGQTPEELASELPLKAMLVAARCSIEAKELAEATNPAKPTSRRRI